MNILIRRISKVISNPYIVIQRMAAKNIIPMDDRTFLAWQFREIMGYEWDYKNPRTFVEKVNWLKLYDRNPKYINMADKYEVKAIVKDMIGDQYIIPSYGVFDNFDDICFENLPNEFVIKCTHDCGSVEIIDDKSNLDINKLRTRINKRLRKNLFYYSREWVYKDVKPRIIIEKKITSDSIGDVRDYKFYCFNGYVKALLLVSNRQNKENGPYMDYFDADFNHLDYTNHWHPQAPYNLERPDNFDEMVRLASILSEGIPTVRVDFYNIDGDIFFGEFTFYDKGGYSKMHPDNWDIEWGELIDLSLAYSNSER